MVFIFFPERSDRHTVTSSFINFRTDQLFTITTLEYPHNRSTLGDRYL
jgi:hypothetical protein